MELKELESYSIKQFAKGLEALRKQTLKPPPNLTMGEWAEQHFVVSSDYGGNPGRFRFSNGEYQRGILDAVSNPRNEKVVIMSSAQVGKSLIVQIVSAYYIHQDPSPIMIVGPNDQYNDDFSKRRLVPMARDVKPLKSLIGQKSTKDGMNTIKSKYFPGGSLYLASATIASDLTGKSIRVLLLDECDKYKDIHGVGDPCELAEARTQAFTYNKKIIYCSTPLISDASRIELEYNNSSQGEFNLECIHCNEHFFPNWYDHVKWAQENDDHQPESSLLHCSHCGAGHNDSERYIAIKKGIWIHKYPERNIPGFLLNAMCSPYTKLSELVTKFITVKNDPPKFRQFVNEVLAQTWKEEAQSNKNIPFMDRCEEYDEVTLPMGITYLTAGVDTQDDRLEVKVTGWGDEWESWHVDYEVLHGDPKSQHLWESLKEKLLTKYKRVDGYELGIDAACIDEGGHYGDSVRVFTQANYQRRWYNIKGANTATGRVWPKRAKWNADGKPYVIGTYETKELVFNMLRVKPLPVGESNPGYCHFSLSCDADFFKQLTSEDRKVERMRNGRSKVVWDEKSGVRNEVWDTTRYAYAAAHSLPRNFKRQCEYKINKWLELQALQKPTDKNTDINSSEKQNKSVTNPSESVLKPSENVEKQSNAVEPLSEPIPNTVPNVNRYASLIRTR